MKNIFATLLLLLVINSCSKQEFTDANDNFKRADSLFTKASKGLKTLDSLSKKINHSDGIAKKVILPEIEKQSQRIDSTIRSGSWRIDSINKEIEKITKNVKIGTDVAKTLDSANQALKNGENAISVLSKTADRILNRTKKAPAPTQSQTESQEPVNSRNDEQISTPKMERNPLVKTATLEINVEDISNAKEILKRKIREGNADLVSQNYTQTEGFERENITIKVPLYNFDNLVSTLSNDIGTVQSKSTDREGKDYNSDQMCDIEITLIQKENFASNQIITDQNVYEDESFGNKSSSAFMSGFKVLEDVMIAILPFWPIFIIAGLILYFIRRNRKKKEAQILEESIKTPVYNTDDYTLSKPIEFEKPKDSEEPDYSKYLPKE